jgi:hypothetical protein
LNFLREKKLNTQKMVLKYITLLILLQTIFLYCFEQAYSQSFFKFQSLFQFKWLVKTKKKDSDFGELKLDWDLIEIEY